jgi:hypothetical protein
VDLDTCFTDYGSAAVKSDTTCDVKIKKGASYTAKLTCAAKPTMTVGTSGVLKTVLTQYAAGVWMFKVTAVGASGSRAGVFANGKKLFTVTVK